MLPMSSSEGGSFTWPPLPAAPAGAGSSGFGGSDDPAASAGDRSNYAYSNCYAIPRFVKYCRSLGVKDVRFEDMKLDFALEPPADKDVLQTHTERTAAGGRLEVTGVLLLNWKLAVLTL